MREAICIYRQQQLGKDSEFAATGIVSSTERRLGIGSGFGSEGASSVSKVPKVPRFRTPGTIAAPSGAIAIVGHCG